MDKDKKLTLYFDSECPLCSREISWLKSKNQTCSINFVDIVSPDFDETKIGKSKKELLSKIHAKDSEGNFITGVDVFREVYTMLGMRSISKLLSIPILKYFFDVAYVLFAYIRPFFKYFKRA